MMVQPENPVKSEKILDNVETFALMDSDEETPMLLVVPANIEEDTCLYDMNGTKLGECYSFFGGKEQKEFKSDKVSGFLGTWFIAGLPFALAVTEDDQPINHIRLSPDQNYLAMSTNKPTLFPNSSVVIVDLANKEVIGKYIKGNGNEEKNAVGNGHKVNDAQLFDEKGNLYIIGRTQKGINWEEELIIYSTEEKKEIYRTSLSDKISHAFSAIVAVHDSEVYLSSGGKLSIFNIDKNMLVEEYDVGGFAEVLRIGDNEIICKLSGAQVGVIKIDKVDHKIEEVTSKIQSSGMSLQIYPLTDHDDERWIVTETSFVSPLIKKISIGKLANQFISIGTVDLKSGNIHVLLSDTLDEGYAIDIINQMDSKYILYVDKKHQLKRLRIE
jgi:hypothetical protein